MADAPGAHGSPEADLGPAASEAALDEWLSRPGPALPLLLEGITGDLLVLGAGGKMGPTLARMARRAFDQAGGAAGRRRVIAVSRFSSAAAERALREAGVETVRCDLADARAVATLPDAANVVFMTGQKFGTRDNPALT